MSIIRPIQSTDSYTYPVTPTKETSNFDQVLQQETIIYADAADDTTFMNAQGVVVTPPVDATASVAAATSTNSTTAPADLEPIFEQAAQQYGISKDLLKAVAKAESNFNPSVVSSAGAIGVMQLMPDTAKSLGVTNPYDATENIMGGARYLSQLLSQYNGDTALALAAYNAGSGNVAKYGGIPPFKETQNYVNKILADAGIERTSDAATIYAVAANSATHTL